MKTTEPTIVITQSFNSPIANVWKAITNISEMKQWFFSEIPNFKAKVGFKTKFNIKAPSRDFLHCWEIIEVIPNKKIVYKWSYRDLEGLANVIFELSENNGKTKLTLSNIVLKDFSENIPEFSRDSCVAGWEYFIHNRLKNYLLKD